MTGFFLVARLYPWPAYARPNSSSWATAQSHMQLFICEKPSQAKDIAPHVGARQRGDGCFVGGNVAVTWCVGHLLEQAKPEAYAPELKRWSLGPLPVLPDRWIMDVKASTKDQYAAVTRLIKQANEVVIATDADREGEVIAREILERVRYSGPIQRLWLRALDDASVRAALGKLLPNEKTKGMYYSGMGRSRADWLAGMNVTMALTTAFGSGGGRAGVLHCGRVQTPVLALVVRRERAITNFKPKTHYVLSSQFEMMGTLVPMDWLCPQDRLDAEGHCVDRTVVDAAVKRIHGKAGKLSRVQKTPEREPAPLLYSLGSLQRDASAKFGLKAFVVLEACQALYEKHKATTYPRTDCEHLPVSMHGEAKTVLSAVVKADPKLASIVQGTRLDVVGRAFNDQKVTAHHAIVPTSNAGVRAQDMSPTEYLIYDLIRRRYMAQFMGDYEYTKTVIEVHCEGELFSKTGKTPVIMGWRTAYTGMTAVAPRRPSAAPADREGVKEVAIPAVMVGDPAINRHAETTTTQTKPPKRYTEGTLLAAMESIDKVIDDPRLRKIMQTKEKAGIGTDATRASIIEGLFKREYISNDKKAIIPTVKGQQLIELIERISPELADPVLTAMWEEQLMQIEEGTIKLADFERSLSNWLGELIDKIRAQAGTIRAAVPLPGSDQAPTPCPTCGGTLRQRKGPSGVFWGCSGFPDCRTTLPDAGGKPGDPLAARAECQPGDMLEKSCNCGKPMRLRQGARGPFYGCTGFPMCKQTSPVQSLPTAK
jgi:DNA topoisomerase-3